MRIHESGVDRTPDTPTTSNTSTVHNRTLAPSVCATTTTASSVADTDTADISCPHCTRTFTSRIGLVGHFRIHRTETGEPVPGAPTYTHQARLNCPHCPRTFRHRMGLFGHMRITTTCGRQPPVTPHLHSLPTTSTNTTTINPPEINTHTPHAPNFQLPRKWEVRISTRSPCGFGCTGELSPRLSRHVKCRG
nr:unnamed protein product [Spirometra erinaceieuropaei]